MKVNLQIKMIHIPNAHLEILFNDASRALRFRSGAMASGSREDNSFKDKSKTSILDGISTTSLNLSDLELRI